MSQRTLVLLSAGLPTLLLAACTSPAPQQTPAVQAAPAARQAESTKQPPVSGDDVTASDSPSDTPQGKRAPGQDNVPFQAYRAFGTEPFWSARVEGDRLVFSTPEDQAGKTMSGKRVPSLRGFSFQGKDGDVEFNLDIQQAQCSDGMSDNVHKFESIFIYGDVTYRGCAEQAMAK